MYFRSTDVVHRRCHGRIWSKSKLGNKGCGGAKSSAENGSFINGHVWMRIGEAANDVEEDSMVGITNGRSFSKIFTSWFMQVFGSCRCGWSMEVHMVRTILCTYIFIGVQYVMQQAAASSVVLKILLTPRGRSSWQIHVADAGSRTPRGFNDALHVSTVFLCYANMKELIVYLDIKIFE